MLEIGNKIRELRVSKKLSQKQLAEFLNVTPQTISKWELNKSYPDIEMLVKISQIFDVSTDSILGKSKRSFFDSFFKKKGPKNMYPEKERATNVEKSKGAKGKKKVAFVLYTSQGLGVTYLSNVVQNFKLESKLHEELDDTYDITFRWEEAQKLGVALLVIPDPFFTIINANDLPEIKIPASLFYEMKIEEIKASVDAYFNSKSSV